MSVESIGDILSGKEPAPIEVPEKVEPTTDEKAAPSAAIEEPKEEKTQARDDAGKFKKADEPKPEKPRADVAAIIDERRKRQALEARIQELESTKAPAKPSIFDNEDEAISARVSEQTKGMREQLYRMSMKAARREHGESFHEAEQAFMEAAENDPRLYQGLQSTDDPGEYIVTIGLQLKELSEVGGDILKYKAKVTGETSAKLLETQKQVEALAAQVEALTKANKELESLPRSLNNKSSGTPKAGDADEDDIKSLVRFK